MPVNQGFFEIINHFVAKDVQAPNERNIRVQTKYVVDKDNPWIAAYDDCLYTKDCQRLIGCPLDKENIKFPQGVKIIGERAFGQCRFKELIIPWGVTTLEPSSIIIYSPANPYPPEGEPIPKVILPDTILVNKVIFSERTPYLHFCYSPKRQTALVPTARRRISKENNLRKIGFNINQSKATKTTINFLGKGGNLLKFTQNA